MNHLMRLSQPSSSVSVKYAHLMLTFLLLFSPAPVGAAGGFRLCGLKLTMTLNAICKNQLCGGYIMGMAKRKSPESEMPPILGLEDGQPLAYLEEENDEPREEEEEANSSARQRQKRSYPFGAFSPVKKSGIATQCCSKRCTLSYLKTYCCAAPTFHETEEDRKNESS